MRLLKYFVLSVLLLGAMSAFTPTADAWSNVYFGFSTYHHGYGYHPYWYRPYYGWPRYGYGFYRPYGYGGPYGYGYGGYGYGGYGYGGYPYGRYYGLGEVRLEVKPKSAGVYVDGDYVGVVDDYDGWWQRLKLPPGRHRIVCRAQGYQPYAISLRVLPGQDQHIKQEMAPGDDVIEEKDMRLPERERDDDRYDRDYGHRRREYRDYRDRDYGYRHDRDDHNDHYSYNDRHRRDDHSQRSEPYGEEHGRNRENSNSPLILQVQPKDATVYVDGNYYGTADVNEAGEIQVLLPVGVHKVEVVHPGYETFSKEVNIIAGGNDRLVVNLQKK